MDRKLLKSLDNLSTSLDAISESLKIKGDSDIASALSTGNFSDQLKGISVSIKNFSKDLISVTQIQKKILSNQSEIVKSVIDISTTVESQEKLINDIYKQISINSGQVTIPQNETSDKIEMTDGQSSIPKIVDNENIISRLDSMVEWQSEIHKSIVISNDLKKSISERLDKIISNQSSVDVIDQKIILEKLNDLLVNQSSVGESINENILNSIDRIIEGQSSISKIFDYSSINDRLDQIIRLSNEQVDYSAITERLDIILNKSNVSDYTSITERLDKIIDGQSSISQVADYTSITERLDKIIEIGQISDYSPITERLDKIIDGQIFGIENNEDILSRLDKIVMVQSSIESSIKDKNTIEKSTNTVESVGREEKKSGVFGFMSDKSKDIKDSISTVISIAAGILSIGLALKVVGDVDVKSVLVLSVSLPLIAIAFKKISEIGITPSEVSNLVIVSIGISTAIMLSSMILSNVRPVGMFQALTAILISGVFAGISYGVGPLMRGLKGISPVDALKSSLIIPLLMVSLSGAIAGSSHLLGMVKPVGFFQALTSIMIAGVFTVISYGVGKMLSGFKGVSQGDALKASIAMPILLVALSGAIAASSHLLGTVSPVGFFQALTSIMIAGVFVVLGYAVKPLLNGVKGVSIADMAKGVLVIIALTGAIALSSQIIDGTVVLGISKLISFTAAGIAIGIVSIAMAGAISLVNKMGTLSSYTKGALSIVAISGSIALSSQIISMGDYSKYPSIDWSLNAGLSLAMFGVGAAALGLVSMNPAFWLGILAIPAISLSLMASSHIIALGNYKKYPSVDWSLGTGLSLAAFGVGAVALGVAVMTGVGALAIAAGLATIPIILSSIVLADNILSSGKYDKYPNINWVLGVGGTLTAFSVGVAALGILPKVVIRDGVKAINDISDSIITIGEKFSKGVFSGGPTKEWSAGVGLAIGAFSPIYSMLIKNNIMKIFGGGGVGPDDFTKAISTVSSGIIEAANFFASAETSFKKAPPEEWAKGVSLALGAFSPIYSMLVKNQIMKIFGGGVSSEDFSNAIVTITEGIVTSASVFSKFKSSFEDGPPEKWAKGVSLALGAFSPIYSMLVKNQIMKIFGGGVSSNDFSNAIVTITEGIITSAMVFSKFKSSFTDAPSDTWAKGVGTAIGAFAPVFDVLTKTSSLFNRSVSGSDLKNAILTVTSGIIESGSTFSENKVGFDVNSVPSVVWSKAVSASIISFSPVFDFVTKNSGWFGADADDVKDSILSIADSIKEYSVRISGGKYNEVIPKDFLDGISKTVSIFSDMVSNLENVDIDIEDGVDNVQDIVDGVKSISESYSKISVKSINDKSIIDMSKSIMTFGGFISVIDKSISMKSLSNSDDKINKISKIINESFTKISSIKIKKIDYTSIKSILDLVSNITSSMKISKDDLVSVLVFGTSLDKIIKVINESFTKMSSINVKTIDNSSIDGLSKTISMISESLSTMGKVDLGGINLSDLDKAISTISNSLSDLPNSVSFPDMGWISSLSSIDISNIDFSNLKKVIDSINEISRNSDGYIPLKDWSSGFGSSVDRIKSSSDIINSIGSINGEFTNLNKISDAFNVLTRSVEEFSNSISNIDSNKISSALSPLSGTSIVVKMASDDKINELIKGFDDGSNKIIDAINNYNRDKERDDSSENKTVSISRPNNDNNEFKKLSEKVDTMTSLLSDIASVVGSKGALKNYILSIQSDISIGKK